MPNKNGGSLNWRPWKQESKEKAKAIYAEALKAAGIAKPMIFTIHKYGSASVQANEVTLKLIEAIPGVSILSGLRGKGDTTEVEILIPAVESWLAELAANGQAPYYLPGEQRTSGASDPAVSEAEKEARRQREESRKRMEALFRERFGATLPGSDESEADDSDEE